MTTKFLLQDTFTLKMPPRTSYVSQVEIFNWYSRNNALFKSKGWPQFFSQTQWPLIRMCFK